MDYETMNRASWDERAPAHVTSPDYEIKHYISDPSFIGHVVKFDRPYLGDITGLDCIHLQCHIGTDTLSLARLGAASVTGLDFSAAAITAAQELAAQTTGSGGEKLTFVEASVFNALNILPPGSFDLVYVSIGSLCFMPIMKEWAKIITGLLKPGGRLFLREFHPVLWSLDRESSRDLIISTPYFERQEPTILEAPRSYADSTAGQDFKLTTFAIYNHGIGEVTQALLEEGMKLTLLKEHQSAPLLSMLRPLMVKENGEYSLKDRPWRLPLSYTIQAVKE
ncbi:S-adenosylmethionine-dependent methyltransferase family protein [Metarhizium robertsii]|uniref:Methyltransferase type 12 n=2 Tax=Metarhizium robertsii TaxID=568076 RepID=E9ELH7_METRA|nr:Methyltransferase type 12 [Metarhizium robertsii ARSEF 23]EFZ03955.2 Methyltransferase type 12 [Metarhizium robertsii ARSEF 23]EXU99077.1 S-adenosylmethionine-dependent methyltransferase family protein [Metarhizium robertsii]